MVIKCSPKDSNGDRTAVRGACNESCIFWEKCCEEVNVGSVPNRFVEEEPNKYDIEDGIFHTDYKGLKKVWILKKK